MSGYHYQPNLPVYVTPPKPVEPEPVIEKEEPEETVQVFYRRHEWINIRLRHLGGLEAFFSLELEDAIELRDLLDKAIAQRL